MTTALDSKARRPGWRRAKLCALPLACILVVPGMAQQSEEQGMSAVPENVAPHVAPTQPLPFSHKTHVASGLECVTCHTNPDPGSMMTFPATETCMTCHAVVAADKPAIASLREYAESGEEIPWVRVYAVTPGVEWSHRAHLDSGTQCQTCHGDISQAEVVSETRAILAMATCISCHEARAAKNECVTCHAWPTDQLLGFE